MGITSLSQAVVRRNAKELGLIGTTAVMHTIPDFPSQRPSNRGSLASICEPDPHAVTPPDAVWLCFF